MGGGVVEVRGKMEGAEEGEQGDGERSPLHGLATIGQQREEDGTGQWDEDDDAEDGVL